MKLGCGYIKKIKLFGVIPLYEVSVYDRPSKGFYCNSFSTQDVQTEPYQTTQDVESDDSIDREFWDF